MLWPNVFVLRELTWTLRHAALAHMIDSAPLGSKNPPRDKPPVRRRNCQVIDLWNNKIVEETRQVRDRYAVKFDYDRNAESMTLSKISEFYRAQMHTAARWRP